jgi:hypothetical protein
MRPKVAAKAIGVSEGTLKNLRNRGAIPFAKIDGCVLFPTAAILRWLEEITENPPVKRPEQAKGGEA